MSYRFSAGIVYNNFPWPLVATAKQRQAIAEAAQAVLDVRVKYPVSSLADHLYGTMPPDLFKARQKLDAAVDAAFSKEKFSSDTDYVAFLFELYQQILPGMIAPALLDAAAAGLKRPALRHRPGPSAPFGGHKSNRGDFSRNGKDDERGTTRESPLALGALAQGARHRPKTTGKTAVACGRRLTIDMVQAAQTGAAGGSRGICTRHPRPCGSFRGSVDARPCPMRGA